MHTHLHKPFLVLCALLLAACGSKQSAVTTSIDGAVRVSSTVKLAQSGTLELTLEDVSVDGPAVQIATTRIDGVRQLPWHYSLPYDASRIDRSHRYTVSARLYVDQQVRYATDTAYEVLTQGNGSYVDLFLASAGATADAAPAVLPEKPGSVVSNHLEGETGRVDYRAAFIRDRLAWIEEERRSSNMPRAFHARYEFNGAYLQRYSDNVPVEIDFDERGRPVSITERNQSLQLENQRTQINAVRNRAALLRSHALASRDTQRHRLETQ